MPNPTKRGGRLRPRRTLLLLAVLAMSAVLSACGAAGSGGGSAGDAGDADRSSGERGSRQQGGQEEKARQGPDEKQPEDKKMTEEAKDQQIAPEAGTGGDAGNVDNELEPAEDRTLKLTVPKMAEIEDDEIPTGEGTNEALLRDYAAIRLPYTGFPWQEEANVYIAGHRIGFPGTNSDLAFYDLDKVVDGDEVLLEDADGRRYTYEVFETKVVEPTDLSVLKRVEGKNMVTLQTCTLPDYTKRLIVRAELKDIEGA